MKKNSFMLSATIVAGVFMIVPFIASSQLGDASSTRQQIKEGRREAQQQIKEDQAEILRANKDNRQELHKEVGAKLRAVQGDIQIEREALKTEIKGLVPDEAKKRIEEFRKDAKNKREEVRTEIRSERDAFLKKANERHEELKKKAGEERAKRIEEYFTQMVNRMDAAVDRLDTLADRIQSRLDIIRDGGKDITESQAALDTARVAIAGVHTAISEAKTKFSELAKSDTPKEQFVAIKELVNTVKTKSKEAHAALVEVIRSIKEGRLDQGGATSTPQTQNK